MRYTYRLGLIDRTGTRMAVSQASRYVFQQPHNWGTYSSKAWSIHASWRWLRSCSSLEVFFGFGTCGIVLQDRTLLQDTPNMLVLVLLYMMQGVPLGLTMGAM